MSCRTPETITVASVLRRLVTHPWRTLVLGWNWKAAVLSAVFRAFLFVLVAARRQSTSLAAVWVELVFRLVFGGLWGSLVQSFRLAEPAWLTALVVSVALPTTLHLLEFAALAAGHAPHIRSGMTVSVAVTAVSLFFNWGLMRRGLLLTGEGTESLLSDLRRMPRAIRDLMAERRARP